MKKLFSISLFCLFSIFIYASEVSDLLQEAQTAYESGDVTTAILKLDSAKSIMEKEQLAYTVDDYIEITSWDVVKMKKNEYDGKKIKFKTKYFGPNSDGTVYLENIGNTCTYDESLIDKLLSLRQFERYTFYGTVFLNYSRPSLHIEAIE